MRTCRGPREEWGRGVWVCTILVRSLTHSLSRPSPPSLWAVEGAVTRAWPWGGSVRLYSPKPDPEATAPVPARTCPVASSDRERDRRGEGLGRRHRPPGAGQGGVCVLTHALCCAGPWLGSLPGEAAVELMSSAGGWGGLWEVPCGPGEKGCRCEQARGGQKSGRIRMSPQRALLAVPGGLVGKQANDPW